MVETRRSGTRRNERERVILFSLYLPLPYLWQHLVSGMPFYSWQSPEAWSPLPWSDLQGREGEEGMGERERWREKVVVRVSDVETVKKRWSVKTMIDCLPRTWHHRCWEHIAKLTGNAHSSEHLTELIVRSDLSIPYSSSETSISQTDWKVSYSAAVTLMCVLCVIWVESFDHYRQT